MNLQIRKKLSARKAREKERDRKRRAKELEKVKARKARELLLKQKRKEKREARVLPKKRHSEWASAVREQHGGKCVVCGVGDVPKLNEDGTPRMTRNRIRETKGGKLLPRLAPHPVISRLNAHHLLPKERYLDLKYDPMNGVLLCPQHHKTGKFSAHRNPIWFTLWLREHMPEKFVWCKCNMGDQVWR